MTRKLDPRLLLVTLSLVLAALQPACEAGGGDDLAVLTIVGPADLTLAPGATTRLLVRHHDPDGRPLAGHVSFEVGDAAPGASLASPVDEVAADGIAAVSLTVDAVGRFAVRASAEGADPVEWTIEVEPSRPFGLAASYTLTSHLPLPAALLARADGSAAALLDLTDDPLDPAAYVLDRVVDTLGGATAELVTALRPGIDAALNLAIATAAPDGLTRLRELGDRLRVAGGGVELISRLTLTSAGDVPRARHRALAFGVTIGETTTSWTAGELGLPEVLEAPMAPRLDDGELELPEHTVPLPYGRIMAAALDEAIAPALDPNAGGLAALLADAVGCRAIGELIGGWLGEEELFADACALGLAATADWILADLRALDEDSPTDLVLRGVARVNDRDADRVVDVLEGEWSGEAGPAGAMVALPPGATLRGERR